MREQLLQPIGAHVAEQPMALAEADIESVFRNAASLGRVFRVANNSPHARSRMVVESGAGIVSGALEPDAWYVGVARDGRRAVFNFAPSEGVTLPAIHNAPRGRPVNVIGFGFNPLEVVEFAVTDEVYEEFPWEAKGGLSFPYVSDGVTTVSLTYKRDRNLGKRIVREFEGRHPSYPEALIWVATSHVAEGEFEWRMSVTACNPAMPSTFDPETGEVAQPDVWISKLALGFGYVQREGAALPVDIQVDEITSRASGWVEPAVNVGHCANFAHLLKDTRIGWGQAPAWSGTCWWYSPESFAFDRYPEAGGRGTAWQVDWTNERWAPTLPWMGDRCAWGFFGSAMPYDEPNEEDNEILNRVVQGHLSFLKPAAEGSGIWRWPPTVSLAGPRPGDSGGQTDFGNIPAPELALTGHPSFILMLGRELMTSEGMRPVHYVEENGKICSVRDHRKVLFWDSEPQRYFWGAGSIFGKLQPTVLTKEHGLVTVDIERHLTSLGRKVYGHDNEHATNWGLWAYYATTYDPWARRELEHQAENFLFQRRALGDEVVGGLDDPNYYATTIGTIRSCRLNQFGLNAASAIGGRVYDDVLEVLRERSQRLYNDMRERATRGDGILALLWHREPVSDRMRRVSENEHGWFASWEQLCLMTGELANLIVMPDIEDLKFAVEEGFKNIVQVAIQWFDPTKNISDIDGKHVAGYQIVKAIGAWPENERVPDMFDIYDPVRCEPTTLFKDWARGTIRTAKKLAERDQDEKLLAHIAAVDEAWGPYRNLNEGRWHL